MRVIPIAMFVLSAVMAGSAGLAIAIGFTALAIVDLLMCAALAASGCWTLRQLRPPPERYDPWKDVPAGA